MKKFAIVLGASALMLPAAAQAGYYGSNCGSTATMNVQCERGVKVYRAQPLQYAPGQLTAIMRADEAKAKNRQLKRKLAMKSRKLKEQHKDIVDLERRLEKIENRNNYRGYRGQSIVGVGFGNNFLSPQRAPGFRNGILSGRRSYGRRGSQGRRHH